MDSNGAGSVLITGGAGRLGAEIVSYLEQSGYELIVIDRDRESLSRLQRAHSLRGHAADVCDPQALEAIAADLARDGQRLRGIVHAAGAAVQPIVATSDLTFDEWRATIELNLNAAFYVVKSFLPLLTAEEGNRSVILLSSVLGLRGASDMAAYSTAKAGQGGLVRALTQELGAEGITVNAIAPSLNRSLTEQEGADAAASSHVPVGRLGLPSDVCGLVGFLLSQEARYISGQTIVVDGGQSAVAYWRS